MTINERIKTIRDTLGLTLRAFASEIGYSHGTISLIEKNQAVVEKRLIVVVCAVFGVSREWLENGTGEMFTAKEENARPLSDDGLVIAAAGVLFKGLPEERQEAVMRFFRRLIDNKGDGLDAMREFPESFFVPGGALTALRDVERQRRETATVENIGTVQSNSGTLTSITIEK